MKTRILLVGRHDPPPEMLDEFGIVEQENVVFAIDKGRRKKQVVELFEMADSKHAHLVFQNIPGVLFPVLYNVIDDYMHIKVGVVVSEAMPEEREEKECVYSFDTYEDAGLASGVVTDFSPGVKTAITDDSDGIFASCTLAVTGHGVMPFRYKCVEWL